MGTTEKKQKKKGPANAVSETQLGRLFMLTMLVTALAGECLPPV